jgi:hypothetical protein
MVSHSSPAQALAKLRAADAGLGAFAAVRDDARRPGAVAG